VPGKKTFFIYLSPLLSSENLVGHVQTLMHPPPTLALSRLAAHFFFFYLFFFNFLFSKSTLFVSERRTLTRIAKLN